MSLEIITGNLAKAYKQAVPGTVQHVDQLQAARVTNPKLREHNFYTADYNQYALRGRRKVPVLGIARVPNNLIFQNIDKAFRQLTTEGNYRPDAAEAERVFRARGRNSTVLVDLTKLNLQHLNSEFSYFEINTSPEGYDSLNPEQRKLAERVEGKGRAFTATMNMLMESGIEKTRIYVLNPDYVRVHAENGPISRASWLDSITSASYFYAYVRGVGSHSGLFGVRKVVAAGDDAKNPLPSEVRVPRFEEVLSLSQRYVPSFAWNQWEKDLRNKFKP